MKQMDVNENVNWAVNTFIYLPPLARPHCVGEHLQCRDGVLCSQRYIASLDIFNALSSQWGLNPLQKPFIHGQPVLQGLQHRASFIPKILFALSHSLCYNHSMLDFNFERDNLDLADHKVKAKVYIEKISHAIL